MSLKREKGGLAIDFFTQTQDPYISSLLCLSRCSILPSRSGPIGRWCWVVAVWVDVVWPLVLGHCYCLSLLCLSRCSLLAIAITRCTKQNKDWTAWEIWSATMALALPSLLLPLLVWRVKSVHTSFYYYFGLGIEVFGEKK